MGEANGKEGLVSKVCLGRPFPGVGLSLDTRLSSLSFYGKCARGHLLQGDLYSAFKQLEGEQRAQPSPAFFLLAAFSLK